MFGFRKILRKKIKENSFFIYLFYYEKHQRKLVKNLYIFKLFNIYITLK